jgi:hypothetical protein
MRSPVKSMLRDEGGAIAPLYALLLPVLVMSGGIAFDYTRLTEMQNAADQAALAAASQLDGSSGACDRAINAARNLLRSDAQAEGDSGNFTVFSNGGAGPSVTIGDQSSGCTATAADPIRFYTTADGDDLATNDEAAKFVEITVAARTARYALTPVGSLINPDGVADGTARAGLGSAICKVPPLMICNPDPTQPFNADGRVGYGVMVTGHGNTKDGRDNNGNQVGQNYTAWAPGDFGFLEAGAGNNADLLRALAYQDPNITCQQVETGEVNTGNPQGLYDAINTRFDIYDFPSNGNNTLAGCYANGGNCPAAANTVKDLVKADTNGANNRCGVVVNGNNGWRLPTNQFAPRLTPRADGTIDSDNLIDAMGLPRDNCHYTSYVSAGGAACNSSSNGRIGNGQWARADYFRKYHSSRTPSYNGRNASTMTRYDTYLWEIENNYMPFNFPAGGNAEQYGRPICSTGSVKPGQDRRVLSVAIVDNCAALRGGSRTADIGEWVDMFLVEPTSDRRGNGATKDQIYMEIIGKSRAAGNGSVDAQTYYRSSPYLVR